MPAPSFTMAPRQVSFLGGAPSAQQQKSAAAQEKRQAEAYFGELLSYSLERLRKVSERGGRLD